MATPRARALPPRDRIPIADSTGLSSPWASGCWRTRAARPWRGSARAMRRCASPWCRRASSTTKVLPDAAPGARLRLDARLLELEITERDHGAWRDTVATLDAISAMGAQLAIDDSAPATEPGLPERLPVDTGEGRPVLRRRPPRRRHAPPSSGPSSRRTQLAHGARRRRREPGAGRLPRALGCDRAQGYLRPPQARSSWAADRAGGGRGVSGASGLACIQRPASAASIGGAMK